MKRVIDIYQQSSRLAWSSDLFETVPIHFEPAPDLIPLPEVSELSWPIFLSETPGNDLCQPANSAAETEPACTKFP